MCRRSARVELDDQVRLHLRGVGDVGELRRAQELGRHLVVIDRDVVRRVALGRLVGFEHQRHFLGLGRQLDRILVAHLEGSDGDAAAVDLHMAVADELARGERRRRELGAVDDGVEAALEQADHVLTGVALAARGFLVILAELTLRDVAVVTFELLLGLKLRAVVGELLGATLAVLAGAVGALVDRGLRTAPDAFAHAAVDLVLGVFALAHSSSRLLVGWGYPRRRRTIVSDYSKSNAPLPVESPDWERAYSTD